MTDWTWNDERVKQLREWAAKGLSASEIAARFFERHDTMPSRNAVIGKCGRVGIRLSGTPGREAAPRSPAAHVVPERRSKPAVVIALRPVVSGADTRRVATTVARRAARDEPKPAPKVTLPLEPPTASTCAPVTLAGLELRHCRFPIGDVGQPGFGFCGADKPDVTRPYCRFHAGVAYVPSAERKRVEKAIDRVAVWGGR
jgi:GcrA cell cycle regulator